MDFFSHVNCIRTLKHNESWELICSYQKRKASFTTVPHQEVNGNPLPNTKAKLVGAVHSEHMQTSTKSRGKKSNYPLLFADDYPS